MAMTGVLRPGHVAVRVLDLDEAVKFYSDVMGLVETGMRRNILALPAGSWLTGSTKNRAEARLKQSQPHRAGLII